MTWDNNKNTFDSRPSVPSDEKLTASEWNTHVSDQKGRVPFGPLADRPAAADASNGDVWFVTDLANDAGIMTKAVSGSWEIMGLGDSSNKLPQVFAESVTTDDIDTSDADGTYSFDDTPFLKQDGRVSGQASTKISFSLSQDYNNVYILFQRLGPKNNSDERFVLRINDNSNAIYNYTDFTGSETIGDTGFPLFTQSAQCRSQTRNGIVKISIGPSFGLSVTNVSYGYSTTSDVFNAGFFNGPNDPPNSVEFVCTTGNDINNGSARILGADIPILG